jgi:hypothetical protein
MWEWNGLWLKRDGKGVLTIAAIKCDPAVKQRIVDCLNYCEFGGELDGLKGRLAVALHDLELARANISGRRSRRHSQPDILELTYEVEKAQLSAERAWEEVTDFAVQNQEHRAEIKWLRLKVKSLYRALQKLQQKHKRARLALRAELEQQ